MEKRRLIRTLTAITLTSLALSSCSLGGDILASSGSTAATVADSDAYSEWLNSDEATDFNGDRKINEDDYNIWVAYSAWFNSDSAADVNGDDKINIADYNIYVGYTAWKKTSDAIDMTGDAKIDIDDYQEWLLYETWKSSSSALDLDGDKDVDDYDYVIYKAFLSWKDGENAGDYNADRTINALDYVYWLNYTKWVAGASAMDINGDAKINMDDYALYLGYLTWSTGKNAKDNNGDGKIDTDDYMLVVESANVLAGTYHIENYVYTGTEFSLVDSELRLSSLGVYFYSTDYGMTTFTISVDGAFSYYMPDRVKALFGTDIAYVDNGLSNAKISSVSTSLIALDTWVTVKSEKLKVSLYLVPISTGFTTSYTLKNGDETAKMTFDLVKNVL